MMRISDSEMDIMKIVWADSGELTCADIMARMHTSRKQTTIQTFLKRLCDKDVLNVRKEGKTNYFSARVSEDEYKRELTEAFLNDTHKGSLKSLFAALAGSAHPDKEDMEEIKKWFDEI